LALVICVGAIISGNAAADDEPATDPGGFSYGSKSLQYQSVVASTRPANQHVGSRIVFIKNGAPGDRIRVPGFRLFLMVPAVLLN